MARWDNRKYEEPDWVKEWQEPEIRIDKDFPLDKVEKEEENEELSYQEEESNKATEKFIEEFGSEDDYDEDVINIEDYKTPQEVPDRIMRSEGLRYSVNLPTIFPLDFLKNDDRFLIAARLKMQCVDCKGFVSFDEPLDMRMSYKSFCCTKCKKKRENTKSNKKEKIKRAIIKSQFKYITDEQKEKLMAKLKELEGKDE